MFLHSKKALLWRINAITGLFSAFAGSYDNSGQRSVTIFLHFHRGKVVPLMLRKKQKTGLSRFFVVHVAFRRKDQGAYFPKLSIAAAISLTYRFPAASERPEPYV